MAAKIRFQTNALNIACLELFENEILIVCVGCGMCASIHQIETLDTVPTTRRAKASCSQCGRIWELPYSYECEHIPLWLATDYRGHRLWAFNERHLSWLETFIGADIREDKVGGSSALHSILPRWMTSSKNRSGVIKGLAELRKKLEAVKS